MAADTNIEDILAIDSSLIPPGFTHSLQIATPPKSSPRLAETFQQRSEKLQSQLRPQQQQHWRQSFQQYQQPSQQFRQQHQSQQLQQIQRQQLKQSPQQKQQPIETIPLQGSQQSEQLQVQQQPNLQQQQQRQSVGRRKGNWFCSWVRKKLWCIRGNSPMEPNLDEQSSEGVLREGTNNPMTAEGSHASNVDLKKSVHHPNDRTGHKSTATGENSAGAGTKSESKLAEGVKAKPKDRQVTFSDTVRTHIKTKYVTAEEYKHIRGMNATTGRIMYQIVNHQPKDKINPFAGNATLCKRRRQI